MVKLDLGMTIVSENSEISEVNKRGDSRKHEVKMPLFSFKSVSAATDNFSDANKLGEGGFGPVYKVRFSLNPITHYPRHYKANTF